MTKRLNRLFNITLVFRMLLTGYFVYTSVAQNYIIVNVIALKILYCPTLSLSYPATVVYRWCLSSVEGGHEIFPSESAFLSSVPLFTWFLSCQSTWRSCRKTLFTIRFPTCGPGVGHGEAGLSPARGCLCHDAGEGDDPFSLEQVPALGGDAKDYYVPAAEAGPL